jgi:signal transduction histidine kinase
MGISAEDQQKLFTPFARVGGVEQTATTGTGLGMWITKEMIELLHGSISVESIKGVGTHFIVTFPQA